MVIEHVHIAHVLHLLKLLLLWFFIHW